MTKSSTDRTSGGSGTGCPTARPARPPRGRPGRADVRPPPGSGTAASRSPWGSEPGSGSPLQGPALHGPGPGGPEGRDLLADRGGLSGLPRRRASARRSTCPGGPPSVKSRTGEVVAERPRGDAAGGSGRSARELASQGRRLGRREPLRELGQGQGLGGAGLGAWPRPSPRRAVDARSARRAGVEPTAFQEEDPLDRRDSWPRLPARTPCPRVQVVPLAAVAEGELVSAVPVLERRHGRPPAESNSQCTAHAVPKFAPKAPGARIRGCVSSTQPLTLQVPKRGLEPPRAWLAH